MIPWILFALSGSILLLIFWRRYLLTRRGVHFEVELEREEQRKEAPEEEGALDPEGGPSELQLKRQAEQRERDEKSRRLREAKKAFKQAELHYSKGDYGLAEKHLLQVLSYDNDHLDANLKLGLLYLQQENLPRAEFFFQKLIDLKESPIYLSNLALTLYQQGRFEESAQLYERAIELDPKKAARFVSLAYVYQELGELEKALDRFEAAYRLEPRNLDYLWILLGLYEKMARDEATLRILKKILELDPYNAEVKGKLILLEERLTPEETPPEAAPKADSEAEAAPDEAASSSTSDQPLHVDSSAGAESGASSDETTTS